MVNHKRMMRISRFVGAAALCCLTAPPSASAQTTLLAQDSRSHESLSLEAQVVPVAARRCTCGRWTCPACQQQKLQIICPPGQTIMPLAPGSMPTMPGIQISPGSPSMPTMPDSGQSFPQDGSSPSNQPSTGEPNANNFNQPNPAAANDLRNSLAQSSSQRNFMGLNSGGIADPGMMGDYFGPTANGASIISQIYNGNSNGNGSPYYPPNDTRSVILPTSFSLQRMKIAENTSPIPQNRIFMNYSLFGNVPLTDDGISVNRLSPGFETLLFSPRTSFEMRTPFATTLDSNVLLDGGTNTDNLEFGNLFFSLKHVLYSRNQFLVSSGLSMTAPTADDVRVFNGAGTEIVRINNDSVHLMPFLGCFYKPSQQSFLQGFLQVDVDANGSSVFTNNNVAQNNLTQSGRLQDLTLLYLDVSTGHWIYRSRGSGLTGIAPMLEGHFNRSLNQADYVMDPSGNTQIQSPIQAYDNFNAVGALIFEFNRRSRLAFGYGVPIGNGSDRAFDSELRITFNRFF